MIVLKFATVQGAFAVLPAEFRYESRSAALAAVKTYAESVGYSNVREVGDADSIRYTARTPGGHGGRNVAFADFDFGACAHESDLSAYGHGAFCKFCGETLS